MIGVELERFLEQPGGLVVLVRLQEQLAPVRAHVRVVGVFLDGRLEVRVRRLEVAERLSRDRLDARIGLLAQHDAVAIAGGEPLAAMPRRVALAQRLGAPLGRVLDLERGRARRGEQRPRQREEPKERVDAHHSEAPPALPVVPAPPLGSLPSAPLRPRSASMRSWTRASSTSRS